MKEYLHKFNSLNDFNNEYTDYEKYYTHWVSLTKDTDIKRVDYNQYIGKFAGYEIAPGNLYYNNDTFDISSSWENHSFNDIYSLNQDSYYFNYLQVGKYFNYDESFNAKSGEINNTRTLHGYRVPSINEFKKILSTYRMGSLVNGTIMRYAFVTISDMKLPIPSSPILSPYEPKSIGLKSSFLPDYGTINATGILIFPDLLIINGQSITYYDESTGVNSLTTEEINEYVSQGCAFLLNCGGFSDSYFSIGNYYGYYIIHTYDARWWNISNYYGYYMIKNFYGLHTYIIDEEDAEYLGIDPGEYNYGYSKSFMDYISANYGYYTTGNSVLTNVDYLPVRLIRG